MSRLLGPTVFASLALLVLGSAVHAGRGSGHASHATGRSGHATSHAGHATAHASTSAKFAKGPSTTSGKVVPHTMSHSFAVNKSGNNSAGSKPSSPMMLKKPGKNSTGSVSAKQYAGNFGVKFKRGVFYRGLDHRQWSARYFHPLWRTSFWYCPSACEWYYWNADKSCYLPSNVISSYPPEIGDEEGPIPPDGEEVPNISANEAPDLPNPEGIE